VAYSLQGEKKKRKKKKQKRKKLGLSDEGKKKRQLTHRQGKKTRRVTGKKEKQNGGATKKKKGGSPKKWAKKKKKSRGKDTGRCRERDTDQTDFGKKKQERLGQVRIVLQRKPRKQNDKKGKRKSHLVRGWIGRARQKKRPAHEGGGKKKFQGGNAFPTGKVPEFRPLERGVKKNEPTAEDR